MSRTTGEKDMFDGYLDGFDPNSPAPSDNRSDCYLHGVLNGRDDFTRSPRASATRLLQIAESALAADTGKETVTK